MPPLLDKYYDDVRKMSPLVYYRMREGSGTTMTDSSLNLNNGTYNGSGVSWVTQAPIMTAGAASNGKNVPIFNSHLAVVDWDAAVISSTSPSVSFFDGAAGRATATLNSPAINTAAASVVTLEMWVKWDGNLAGVNGTFEALANFGGATGLLLGFLKNGAADYRFGLSVRNTGDLWGLNNGTTLAALTRDTYHHVVFVIVNNAVQTSKLYIDGVLYTMTQQIGTSTTTDSVTSAFALGYDGTASFFGGSIAEVAVYNGEVMNATAVKNHYHQGAFGAEYKEYLTLPGIESQIEVGTLNFVMNDKNPTLPGNRSRTLDQYYINDIGGFDDSDIRFQEESAFYRDGTNPLTAKYGGRTVTFGGYIEASNFQKLRQLQAKLKFNASGSSLGELAVVMRNVWNNGMDMQLNARKNTGLQMSERQEGFTPRRNFLLTMRSSHPFFETTAARTDVVVMGATLAIPYKGNAPSYPTCVFWGPFSDASLIVGGSTLRITGAVALSSAVTVDSKLRTCTNWSMFNTSSVFPVLAALPGALENLVVQYADFSTVTGGTAGVTRVEITWKNAMR